MREIRYKIIADELRRRVLSNEFPPGTVLPSEADLSDDFRASRVTVRRALEVLRDEGLLESRKGFGWLVAAGTYRQDLSRLGTIERQLSAAGVRSRRQVLSFGFVPPTPRARSLFGSGQVLEVSRLHLADDVPFARVTVWCPERFGSALSRRAVERQSFLEQLDVEIGGATQTIGAEIATSSDAELLGIPRRAAVLVAERITRDVAGLPVLLSEHVFPAHRTRFVVELPVDDGALPAGLRLVE
jgi:GntR family transcriptional regulator